jgi:hypothetical protein
MRKNILLAVFFLAPFLCSSQESSFDNVIAPSNANCSNPIIYKASVTNVGDFPLTGAAIVTEIFNETNTVAYTDTTSGPDIAPMATYQFTITVPGNSLPFNGTYQARFTFIADVDLNPNIQTPFFPLTIQLCAMSLAEAMESMNFYVEENIDLGQSQVGFIYPQLIPANTHITSFDGLDFDQLITSDFYFALVVSDFIGRFEQPCKYLVMNPIWGFITEYDAYWYPVINGKAWNPVPFGELQFTEFDLPQLEPPTLFFDPIEPDPDTAVCAILISGTDNNDTMQMIFESDLISMKENLMNNPLGPKLMESQIIVRKGISGDSLRREVDKLNEGYNKIYFYYSGHGSKSGKMCTGTGHNEWITYSDFLGELYNTRAMDFCLFFDCCYSGKAVTVANERSFFLYRNVEIVTGASDEKLSTSSYYWENNQWVGQGTMTGNMITCSASDSADVDGNDRVSWIEAYDWVLDKNPTIPGTNGETIVEKQNPFHYQNKYDKTLLDQLLLESVNESYPNISVQSSEIFLHNSFLVPGDVVTSFDGLYENVIQEDQAFGWINWEANASFGKDVTYAFIDLEDLEISFVDQVQFWPKIPGYDNYNPYSYEDLIFGELFTRDIPVPSHIYEEEAPPVDPKDSICAIVVTGVDKRKAYQDRYWENATQFGGNLVGEKLGPRLHPENILYQPGISKDALFALLESMKNKYNKVYFYYSGHGSRTDICTGANSSEWTNHRDLLQALNEVNAGEYCIIIDACYSGNLPCEQKRDQLIDQANVEIFTSANKNKYSYGNYHRGGSVTGYSVFTFNLMKCFGDPAADKNGDGTTSLKESYDWFIKQKPVNNSGNDIIKLQCPMSIVSGKLIGNDNGGTFEISGTGLKIRQRKRSQLSYDIWVAAEFNIEYQETDNENIYSISPNRRWTVSGELNPSNEQAIDYIFSYDESLDSLKSDEGVIGIVFKPANDSIWQIHYPTIFDEKLKEATALDIQNTGYEYALAKIKAIETSVHDPFLSNKFSLFPNPADHFVYLTCDEKDFKIHSLSIIDGNGRELHHFPNISGNQKEGVIGLQLPDLASGVYFIQIDIGNGMIHKPIVLR